VRSCSHLGDVASCPQGDEGEQIWDTKPEIEGAMCRACPGMRYRVAARPIAELRRTADLDFVVRASRSFVDGCFWHGCPTHRSQPKSNADYWAIKIETNRARDAHTTSVLQAAGWTVMRFWSHEEPHA